MQQCLVPCFLGFQKQTRLEIDQRECIPEKLLRAARPLSLIV